MNRNSLLSNSVLTLILFVLTGTIIYFGNVMHNYARVQSMMNITSEMTKTLHILTTDSELLEIYNRGKKDFDSLNPSEQSRARAYVQGFFNTFYQEWYSWKLGMLPDAYWRQTEMGLKAILQTSLFSNYWQQRSGVFPADFQAQINNLLESQ